MDEEAATVEARGREPTSEAVGGANAGSTTFNPRAGAVGSETPLSTPTLLPSLSSSVESPSSPFELHESMSLQLITSTSTRMAQLQQSPPLRDFLESA